MTEADLEALKARGSILDYTRLSDGSVLVRLPPVLDRITITADMLTKVMQLKVACIKEHCIDFVLEDRDGVCVAVPEKKQAGL